MVAHHYLIGQRVRERHKKEAGVGDFAPKRSFEEVAAELRKMGFEDATAHNCRVYHKSALKKLRVGLLMALQGKRNLEAL